MIMVGAGEDSTVTLAAHAHRGLISTQNGVNGHGNAVYYVGQQVE